MAKKALFITAILFTFCFYNVSSFCEDDVELADKYSFLKMPDRITSLVRPAKQFLSENSIDLDFFAGILQGYDNNVDLNPDRNQDGFLQTSIDTDFAYRVNDDFRLKIVNSTTNILYYQFNDADLLDIYTTFGVEGDLYLLDFKFTLDADYGFDFVYFPFDEDGTYLGNEVTVSAKHYITDSLYYKLGYFFLYKYFTSNKVLDSHGNTSDDLRKDARNGIDTEFGIYFDRAVLKFRGDIFYNDSNDQYSDYYDYWSWKLKPSVILLLTEKLYTIASFAYEQRNYDRRLSTKNNETVYDDTFTLNSSLLYGITPTFTLAVNYSYRENVSNEPLQKYSGSVITAGAYFTF